MTLQIIMDGDAGEVVSKNCPTSPLFQTQGEVVLHKIYRKNIPKDFSSKLQKAVKTSPSQICRIIPDKD